MKVMFYCQHVQGASHLVRSAEIARALSQGDDVTFVSGGVLPQASLSWMPCFPQSLEWTGEVHLGSILPTLCSTSLRRAELLSFRPSICRSGKRRLSR